MSKMDGPLFSEKSRLPITLDSEEIHFSDEGKNIFFAAVETTRMPMVVTDPRKPNNPIIFVNNAFEEMTGYSQAEILGRNCRFLQGPDTDKNAIDEIRNAIREEREISVELLNYRKDGSSFWNVLFISPVHNEAGELIYFFGSQLDASRRRDAEDALRQAQKMEALGQLTGGIAHDFNNLLQVTLGHLDIIQTRVKKNDFDKDEINKSISNIRNVTLKASALTQQMLAFSRKQQLNGRVVNLNRLVSDTNKFTQPLIGKNIKLHFALTNNLWNCRVDINQFEVALVNILVNAKDASRSSGEITIRTDNINLSDEGAKGLSLYTAGRYVKLSISDNGSGIPKDILPHIIDPFFSTKKDSNGTRLGLGLSTVYGFAKQSGGGLAISSEKDIGTTVSLYFPAVDAHEVLSATQSSSKIESRQTENILVVDDREEVAETTALLLDTLGYQTTYCTSADEALDILRTEGPFQLLMTDLIMPGNMNGVMLANTAKKEYPELRVLLATGFAETILDSADENIPIIFKPFMQADLGRKIKSVLSNPE